MTAVRWTETAAGDLESIREYIRRGGTEIAGLQLYNGALDDESSAYAHKVLAEKQRLRSLIRRGA